MQVTEDPRSLRTRRTGLLAAGVVVIAAGLATHIWGRGPASGLVGDALYAVMIYLLIALTLPRARSLVVGVGALAVCTAVELFQLTGIPAEWGQDFWPIRLILGTGFDALDLVAYTTGAAAAAVCDHALRRRRALRRSRRTSDRHG